MKIVIFKPILIKISLIILLTDANSNAIQLCFHNFFNWRTPNFTNCKKQFFCQKTRKCGFLQVVDSGLLQLKKFRKQSWILLKLASVRSIIYIFFLLKSAEKCQFQNICKLDASTPLHYPAQGNIYDRLQKRKKNILKLPPFVILNKELQEQEIQMKTKRKQAHLSYYKA